MVKLLLSKLTLQLHQLQQGHLHRHPHPLELLQFATMGHIATVSIAEALAHITVESGSGLIAPRTEGDVLISAPLSHDLP